MQNHRLARATTVPAVGLAPIRGRAALLSRSLSETQLEEVAEDSAVSTDAASSAASQAPPTGLELSAGPADDVPTDSVRTPHTVAASPLTTHESEPQALPPSVDAILQLQEQAPSYVNVEDIPDFVLPDLRPALGEHRHDPPPAPSGHFSDLGGETLLQPPAYSRSDPRQPPYQNDYPHSAYDLAMFFESRGLPLPTSPSNVEGFLSTETGSSLATAPSVIPDMGDLTVAALTAADANKIAFSLGQGSSTSHPSGGGCRLFYNPQTPRCENEDPRMPLASRMVDVVGQMATQAIGVREHDVITQMLDIIRPAMASGSRPAVDPYEQMLNEIQQTSQNTFQALQGLAQTTSAGFQDVRNGIRNTNTGMHQINNTSNNLLNGVGQCYLELRGVRDGVERSHAEIKGEVQGVVNEVQEMRNMFSYALMDLDSPFVSFSGPSSSGSSDAMDL
ncbi:hypothetical protein BKA93DRAFT_750478 [Sparassis latifolia]